MLAGTCQDGAVVECTSETVWYAAAARLARFRRRAKITLPDSTIVQHEYLQQKHPVSTGEVRSWLQHHGFAIESLYGDRAGSPYTETAQRAIFWARKS